MEVVFEYMLTRNHGGGFPENIDASMALWASSWNMINADGGTLNTDLIDNDSANLIAWDTTVSLRHI